MRKGGEYSVERIGFDKVGRAARAGAVLPPRRGRRAAPFRVCANGLAHWAGVLLSSAGLGGQPCRLVQAWRVAGRAAQEPGSATWPAPTRSVLPACPQSVNTLEDAVEAMAVILNGDPRQVQLSKKTG